MAYVWFNDDIRTLKYKLLYSTKGGHCLPNEGFRITSMRNY
jgi:hypothetical protein